jgi:hypothetical protein
MKDSNPATTTERKKMEKGNLIIFWHDTQTDQERKDSPLTENIK